MRVLGTETLYIVTNIKGQKLANLKTYVFVH